MFYLQDDAQRFWPKRGMLAYTVDAAQAYATKEEAEKQLRKIRARNPKGGCPWVVVELD